MKRPWWNPIQCTWWYPKWSKETPSIAMLHSVNKEVVDETCPNNTIRPEELEGLIRTLQNNGYHFNTFRKANELPNDKTVVLTFDDGLVDNYYVMFSIIKCLKIPVTCFVTNRGDPSRKDQNGICERFEFGRPENFLSPEMILEMHESGLVEFGGHTANHFTLTDQNLDCAWHDIIVNKAWLEKIIKEEIVSFCYPRGRYSDEIIDLVKKAGYKYAATMQKKMRPITTEPYCIHRQIIPRGLQPWQSYLLATRGKYKL